MSRGGRTVELGAGTGPGADGPARQLVVWCPNWPVVALGRGPGEPVAVVGDQRVLAVSAAAAADGVRVGMRRREAQACCPALVIVDDDPARDARHFEPVVRALADLVPLVEIVEAGTVLFATRGPARWCGGEEAMAERVLRLVRAALGDPGDTSELGAAVGVGIADGRFAATLAARRAVRRGAPVLVAPGRAATAASLAGTAVRVLSLVAGISPDLVGLLERLGITTLGALAELPAVDVAARFGAEGDFAHRLAVGGDDRPPAAVAPPPELAVAQAFDDPVGLLGPLVFSAKQLAEELHARLAGRGETCTRVLVEAETEHGERSERRWHRPGGLSAAAMVERVRWQLDGWVSQHGGLSGGVVLIRLVPEEARADQGRQLGFWGEATQADEFAARAIARVAGLLGADAVTVAEWQGGRHPADRYRWVSAAGVDLDDPVARREALTAPAHPWPGSLGAPSPAWVAAPRLAIEVLDGEGRPVRVDGRGGVSAAPAHLRGTSPTRGGQDTEIVAWSGPWPVEERWWDPVRRRRQARFQVLSGSGEALLVSLEGGTWWLEARYD